MKVKIKFKKGIIQIPLLIGIIVSIVVIIGISYFVFIDDTYRNNNQCKSDCLKKGFENGGCKWPKEMTGEIESLEGIEPYYENVENLGSCVLTFTRHCGNKGQCNCYCFNVATQPIATIATTTTTTTTTQPTATEDWSCGDPVTFNYKGELVTYGTVESQGRCWLDRNLGASRVATAHNDSQSYGDLFQWGRLDDGHQTRTSGTTYILSSTDNPGHSNFIVIDIQYYDWRSPQNDNLWQGENGINNPCPDGWRVPTKAELDAERLSWSRDNYNGAFASPFKLTLAGSRDFSIGSSINAEGAYGSYWSSSLSGDYAYSLVFGSKGSNVTETLRAYGGSVRCLKN